MNRRSFVKNASLIASGSTLHSSVLPDLFLPPPKNKLPKWRGFNLLDFFSSDPADTFFPKTIEPHFKWMRDWGFDFVRIPIAYPTYLKIDRTRNITPDETYQIDEKRVEAIDNLVQQALKYNIHVSLNLHRAPGYCVSVGFHEPFNLWKDEAAQQSFYHHWGMWAKLYKNVAGNKISFDLVNEPAMREDMNNQHSPVSAVPTAVYRKVVIAAAELIRKENKDRIIIADGNNGGVTAMPELADLNIGQSCRGYQPFEISHYKAPWVYKDPSYPPPPKWPGEVAGHQFNRAMLEKFYQPWIDLVRKGVGVHCGECGCFNKTPHPVFLAWFNDVLDILSKNDIGFALWNFVGEIGILNSNRADVNYENWYGYKLDKKLLNLMMKY
jgi:aryl-phospho-beta-D-glucosidase BglC (GH1 family)